MSVEKKEYSNKPKWWGFNKIKARIMKALEERWWIENTKENEKKKKKPETKANKTTTKENPDGPIFTKDWAIRFHKKTQSKLTWEEYLKEIREKNKRAEENNNENNK